MTKKRKEEIRGLSGRTLGAAKSAAAKCGVSVEEWIDRREYGERRCFQCKKWKHKELFQIDRSRNGGMASRCKKCISLASTASRYGISIDEVKSLKSSSCEICGRFGKMEIDHDHATGDVRGILCSACNNAIGLFRDSTEVLTNAIAYLRKGKEGSANAEK